MLAADNVFEALTGYSDDYRCRVLGVEAGKVLMSEEGSVSAGDDRFRRLPESDRNFSSALDRVPELWTEIVRRVPQDDRQASQLPPLTPTILQRQESAAS